MKYKPEEYAKAFADAIEGAAAGMEDRMIGRFIALIRKNGDWRFKEKILNTTENELRSRLGGRNIIAEFARDINLPGFLKNIKDPDRLQTRINPDLIAGIRVSVDGKREIDFSFKKKMQKMFF